MTLLLKHIRKNEIIELQNVKRAYVKAGIKRPDLLRLKVEFENGKISTYIPDLYKYKWK